MINIETIQVSQDLFMLFIVLLFVLYPIFYLITLFSLSLKKYGKDTNENMNEKENDKNDGTFVLNFRRTSTETLLINRIEEIAKSRNIQFAISCYYYNSNKSIKGCFYIITSKVLYKLFFIKNSLICKEIHKFSSFISYDNKNLYNKLILYLSNNNFEKQNRHNEFFTWSHYYLTKNYVKETESLDEFLKTL
jgi:hypothetical protein